MTEIHLAQVHLDRSICKRAVDARLGLIVYLDRLFSTSLGRLFGTCLLRLATVQHCKGCPGVSEGQAVQHCLRLSAQVVQSPWLRPLMLSLVCCALELRSLEPR